MSEDGKNRLRLERGRQLFLFLFCLFLAFVIWTVHKLSDDYSHFFQYKTYLSTTIKGRDCTSGSINNLTVRGRASGFYILQHRFFSKGATLTIAPAESIIRKSRTGKDRFFVLVSDIRDLIVESVSDKLSVEYLSVDTLFFEFQEVSGKNLPIAVRGRITFKEQYTSASGIKITPTHIYVTGEAERLNEIDSVYTENIIVSRTDKEESGCVKLKDIPGVEFSTKEVYYTLETLRYVEEKLELPVLLKNLPDSVNAVVKPSTVTLYIRQEMKKASDLMNSNISIMLDYNKLGSSKDTLAVPKVSSLPQGCFGWRIDPPVVELRIL